MGTRKKKVVTSANADDDLGNITHYLVENYPDSRVDSVLKSIYDAVDIIALHPDIAPIVEGNYEIRRKVVNYRYSIYYVIKEEQIRILHIWHNARDPQDLTLEAEE